ncbi:zinc dependent phospholipase C family protein [uncultured Paludibaculum sp.]|uniref:zinc dependent phospholipase C family protein n=1 Tax=uncultured Paludibaculum sp. TaxID=1765020 RepID=UPI002AAB7B8D|nr:zinc dependent phospholipase C family protein [uncultured Paludibaculum sp.]
MVLTLLLAPKAHAYSILAHEAIIDAAWDISIKGVLLQRFPDATPEQLQQAHAYAYGGSIIQDMGYYPFGSKLFSNLLHYVRSGDFVLNLIRESQDLNEYAFALGALSHYASDNNGHSMATNVAIPMLYPKLRQRFGDRVTYADDALSHVKTELAFDVLQVAQGHYAPDSYHGFIGFEVARPVLERAFYDTYGLTLGSVFTSVHLAIGSYRHSVGSTIPAMTRVAWQLKKNEIVRDAPGITRKRFLYNLSRASYHKEWGKEYQQPGFRSKLLAFVLNLLPRVGKARALRFETPTPAVERLFMASFSATLDRYKVLLSSLRAGPLRLPNENFDVGQPTMAGTYTLSDETYAQLLGKLEGHFPEMVPELRRDVLNYYGDLSASIATKSNEDAWAKVVKAVAELKGLEQDTKTATPPQRGHPPVHGNQN